MSGWLSNYSYRRCVTINNVAGSALSGAQFNLLLHAGNFDFTLPAFTTGADLRIADSDGVTLLNVWIQSYSATAQTASLWILVPTIPAGVNYTVYIYFGNTGATTVSSYDTAMQKLGVDANTRSLWHFDDSSTSSSPDAAGNYAMTLVGTPTRPGTDGGSWSFQYPAQTFASGSSLTLNGSSQYGTAGAVLQTPPAAGTIELWVKYNSLPGSDTRIFCAYNNASPYNGIDLYRTGSTGAIVLFLDHAGTTVALTSVNATLTAGVWYHIAATWGTGVYLYINGIEEAYNSYSGNWASGTAAPFCVGALTTNGSSFTNYGPISVDELRISTVQRSRNEIIADSQRRTYVPNTTQIDKWAINSTPILTGTQSWENSAVVEPCIIVDTTYGKYRMYYSAGWASSGIGYAECTLGNDPTIAANWSKPLSAPIVGQGHGGVSGFAAHHYCILVNGVFYLYFSTGSGSGAVMQLCTSTDGKTFAYYGQVLPAAGAGGLNGVGNSTVIVDASGLWTMLFDRGNSGSSTDNWQINRATSLDGKNWTEDSRNPVTSLQIGGSGNYSGASFGPYSINGRRQVWLHGYGSEQSNFPGYGFYAQSDDDYNWQMYPACVLSGLFYGNQPAVDLNPAEYSGTSYMFFDGTNNAADTGQIYAAKNAANTLTQTVTDSFYAYLLDGVGQLQTPSAAAVQSGLTAQGYTTTRATEIDLIATTLSSVAGTTTALAAVAPAHTPTVNADGTTRADVREILGVAAGGDPYPVVTNGTYGLSALQTLIAAIQTAVNNINNLSALANLIGPPVMEIPATGSIVYPCTLWIRDSEGHLEDLSASPTLTAANGAGTSRSANLSAVTHAGTGQYTFTYTVQSSAAEEGVMISATGTAASDSTARAASLSTAVVGVDTATAIGTILSQTTGANQQANVQAGLTTQGYTTARAGTIPSSGTISTYSGGAADADAATILAAAQAAQTQATAAAGSAATSVSQTTQSAIKADLTSQGLTGAADADAAGILSEATAAATQTTSAQVQADVQAGMTSQGFTSAVATALGGLVPPTLPGQLTGNLTTTDGQGNPKANVVLNFALQSDATGATAQAADTTSFTLASNDEAVLEGKFEAGCTYVGWTAQGTPVQFTVPSTGTTFGLPAILGKFA